MVVLTVPTLGMVVGLGLLLVVLLGYEYRVPFVFAIVMVPLIMGMALGSALGLYIAGQMYGVSISITMAMAAVTGLTLLGLIGFEAATD